MLEELLEFEAKRKEITHKHPQIYIDKPVIHCNNYVLEVAKHYGITEVKIERFNASLIFVSICYQDLTIQEIANNKLIEYINNLHLEYTTINNFDTTITTINDFKEFNYD